MSRLFGVSVRDEREGGDRRGVATLWLLQADGTVRQDDRPLDLFYDLVDPAGPTTVPHFYGGRPVRTRRVRVGTKAAWRAAQDRYRAEPEADVSWLGMKPDEAFLIQHGLRLGDYVRPGGWTDADRADEADLCFDTLPVLSFDLETSTKDPADEGARILTIGAHFTAADGRVERYAYQLGSVAPDSADLPGLRGTAVQTFGHVPPNSARSFLQSPTLDPAEAAMLAAFERLVQRLDPRVLLGHNIEGFDVCWLVRRFEALLGRPPAWTLGPGGDAPVFYYEVSGGKLSRRTTTLDGRVYVDTCAWSRKQIGSERSYRLDVLARKYLGVGKEDVPYDRIVPYFLEGPEERGKLASYCVTDADVTKQYADTRQVLAASFAMGRQTHLAWNRFLGQSGQAFVYATYAHTCLEAGVFLPWARHERWPKCRYEGGHVFDVKEGFYGPPRPLDADDRPDDRDIVVTVDFMSLYPTAEIAYNICPYTLVDDPDDPGAVGRVDPADVQTTPGGYTYWRPERREGITRAILRKYLAMRGVFKRRMKAAATAALRAALNAAQLAAKTICNTVYGTFGAANSKGGKLPCLPAAISTTAAGRHHILETDRLVADHFGPMGVERIGGDTDSVILLVRIREVRKHPDFWRPYLADGVTEPRCDQVGVAFGHALVAWLNDKYPPPMKIELDDCFPAFLYVRKKGYAGAYCQPGPDGGLVPMGRPPDDVKTQGLECKRMDWAPICAETQWHALRALLGLPQDRSPAVNPPPAVYAAGFTEILRWAIEGVAQNRFPHAVYRLERGLTKDIEEYAGTPPPHVRTALRMQGLGMPVETHDRIGFYLVQQQQTRPRRPAEPVPRVPEEVEREGLVIDRRYYLEHYFMRLIARTFEHVIAPDDLSALFESASRGWRREVPASSPFAAFLK